MNYVAFLRGINVGGNNLIKMPELKACFESIGYENVRTYIQSGNVIFESPISDKDELIRQIGAQIAQTFHIQVSVVVLSVDDIRLVVNNAPKWWGTDTEWKHNLLILLPPYDMPEMLKAIGELKPTIEKMSPGQGVIYQSVSLEMFGRSTTGKLANNPVYKRMTIRNYNTTQKLYALMNQ